MRFTARQMADMRRAVGVAEDADGATIVNALGRRLDELAADPAPTPPQAPAAAPSHPDPVAWGIATGRFAPVRASFWDRRLAADRAATGSTAQVEAEIAAMTPVYAPITAVRDPATGQFFMATGRSPASPDEEFPLTREMDRALFGPTSEEREREDAIATERGLAEQLEREREQAAEPPLTADARRAIFGPDEQD